VFDDFDSKETEYSAVRLFATGHSPSFTIWAFSVASC
jgi:hypothetical protein